MIMIYNDDETVSENLGNRCGWAEDCSYDSLIGKRVRTNEDKGGSGNWQINSGLMGKKLRNRTRRRAERTFRHTRGAVVHMADFLKRRNIVVDPYGNTVSSCKERQKQKN